VCTTFVDSYSVTRDRLAFVVRTLKLSFPLREKYIFSVTQCQGQVGTEFVDNTCKLSITLCVWGLYSICSQYIKIVSYYAYDGFVQYL
jgi:hypothetical protein